MALVAATSLLAVAAISGGTQGMQLRAGAKDMAAQFRFARAVAISSGEPQDVVIDPLARRWQGAKGRTGDLPGSGEIVFTGARAAQFSAPTEIGGAQPADDKGVVRFFADGASTGGRVRMIAGEGGKRGGWDVDVGWLTGEVRMSRVQVSP